MTKFKRTISWKMLSLYGLGNILGAGIYVLLPEVAKESGDGLVWSFILAGIVAIFTGITYGALASKYPVSAGAAVYSERAFKSARLSTLIGLSMALTAIVSASALLNGFVRLLNDLMSTVAPDMKALPAFIPILVLLAILGAFAFRGIKNSTLLAVVLTILESAGLLIIIVVAGLYGDIGSAVDTTVSSLGSVRPIAIALGAFIAFYAFIGFEDMVNVAEEVKSPKTSMKRGLIGALVAAMIIYILTAFATISVLDSATIAASSSPLSDVFRTATSIDFPLITIIGLIAITNGALIAIITSSRVLYGLAREGWLTQRLAYVSPTFNTPTTATLLVVSIIAVTAIILPLDALAQITSFMLLIIFTVVQFSALRLIRSKSPPKLSPWIPIIGIIANIAVIILQLAEWFGALN